MPNNIEQPILDPNHVVFVDRVREVDEFSDALNRTSARQPIRTNLFEWFGSPGIGKTMLVHKLASRCDERGYPKIWIDFKEAGQDRVREYFNDPASLVEDMGSDLAAHISSEAWQAFKSEIEQYRSSSPPAQAVRAYFQLSREEYLLQKPAWVENLRGVTASLINLIRSFDKDGAATATPVTIFFDETERADFALIDWTEEWLIGPLSQLRHCLIVWTARRPWRWKKPEIRRRIKSSALAVFPPESSKQQIIQNSLPVSLEDDLFRKVYEMTGGHPGANGVVIEELRTWQEPERQIATETKYKPLLEEIFEKFIDQKVLEDLDTDVRLACKWLAIVRVFDSTMLRSLMVNLGGERYHQWSQEQFGELLLRLKQTQLLVWDKGYALDPDLRHIIREYFFVCVPDIYRRANRAALRVYGDWLNRPIENRNMYVIEEIYHLASLGRAGEPVDFDKEFESRLRQYHERINDPESLANALDRLNGDLVRDRDLKELEELVSDFSVEALLHKIPQPTSV